MIGMATPAPARPITAEEFLHMPQSEGAELVDGRIVEVPTGSIVLPGFACKLADLFAAADLNG